MGATVPNFTLHSVHKKRPSKNGFDSLGSSQSEMADFGMAA